MRHVGNLGIGQRLLHGCDELRRVDVVVNVEPDPAPPARNAQILVADDRELALHQLPVGDHDLLAVAREDGGEAPLDLDHAARDVVHLDPVADLQRVVQLQRQPAEHVAQRVLHREGDDGRDHRRGGHQAGQFHPGIGQADHGPQQIAADHDDVFQDPRCPGVQRRQQHPEKGHAG